MKRITKKATRREFLSAAGAASALALIPKALVAQEALEQRLARDPMRPQFHLLPARNWMNDPNGPIYFKGNYHMFFQYNPLAAVWGDMSWNHAISKDMIHWTHLPVALTPTPDSPDSFGVFSGSAIAVGDRVYMVYTGTKLSSRALATIRGDKNPIEESQCLAWSDDPKLERWTKDPVPVIARPPQGMEITGFRDPSAWRQGGSYYMTVGAGVENVGGCVLLYRSKVASPANDLKQWEYVHNLTSGEWNGKKTPNPCDDGEMWECPDFFALGDPAKGGGHVLIYSTLGKVIWESGKLDEATMTFKPLKTGQLDLGAFYAPKTQLDAEGRRILWGWIQERRTEEQMKQAGWSGMMSLPRVLTLDAGGTLRVRALPQLNVLRSGHIDTNGGSGNMKGTLPQATGEFFCKGVKGKPFTLTLSDGANELMRMSYAPETHSFLADANEVVLESGDEPTVHGYVDGSVIELILSERIGYTKRFYVTGSTAPDIVVAATGAGDVALQAWKIAPISPNRLTTPARS